MAQSVASTGDASGESIAIQQLIAFRTTDPSDDSILQQIDSLPTGADAVITPNEDAVHVIAKSNFGYQDSDGDAFNRLKSRHCPEQAS